MSGTGEHGAAQSASARPDLHRLGRRARLWRAAVAGLLLTGLFYGSAWGTDDNFPLGPMTQFAFSARSNGGEIHSHWLEADTAAGVRVKLPMDAVGAGLKRAEVEGQVSRFVRDPSLLQGIADAQRRLHPDRPRYTRIYVVKQIKTLQRGRVVSASTQTRVAWDVR